MLTWNWFNKRFGWMSLSRILSLSDHTRWMRATRSIGTLLLLFPVTWSQTLHSCRMDGLPQSKNRNLCNPLLTQWLQPTSLINQCSVMAHGHHSLEHLFVLFFSSFVEFPIFDKFTGLFIIFVACGDSLFYIFSSLHLCAAVSVASRFFFHSKFKMYIFGTQLSLRRILSYW